MKTPPHIDGLVQFPDLDYEYRLAWKNASSACGACDASYVERTFRQRLRDRLLLVAKPRRTF